MYQTNLNLIRDNGVKKKSTWFYVPSALCEYKAALLDVAMTRGFLDLFKPQGEYYNEYSAMLFKGAQPSSTNIMKPILLNIIFTV